MATSKQTFTVVGFQYEPLRSSDNQSQLDLYDDVDDVVDIESTLERNATNLSEWCKCGQCKAMPSEQECLCCDEIDAIKYFHLLGKNSSSLYSAGILKTVVTSP